MGWLDLPTGFPPLAGECATQSNYGYDVAEGRRGRARATKPNDAADRVAQQSLTSERVGSRADETKGRSDFAVK